MRLRRLCCAFLLLLYCLPACFSQDSPAVTLSESQAEEIRTELQNMLLEVTLLRQQSQELKADSEALQDRCRTLEAQLQAALQNLRESEKSVIELQKQAEELKALLEDLKSQYVQSCRLLTKERNRRRFWMGATLAMTAAALTEGAVLFFKK